MNMWDRLRSGAQGESQLGQVNMGDYIGQHSKDELLRTVTAFLKDEVGYDMLLPAECSGAVVDFSAIRQENTFVNQIVGMVSLSVEGIQGGLQELMETKGKFGGNAEYTIVLQPVTDSMLLDTFKANDGKLYCDLNEEGIMVWVCFPKEEGLSCFLGESRDRVLQGSFKIKGLIGDHILRAQLNNVLFAEEEEL